MKYRLDTAGNNQLICMEDSRILKMDCYHCEWVKTDLQSDEGMMEISEAEALMYVNALKTAHQAHAFQKDKGGADYISHPIAVSALVKGSLTAVIAALLHDTVEDTELTLEDLSRLGFSDEIVSCVDALTRRKEESREDYLQRVAANPEAIAVKLADLTHNSDLSRIASPTQKDYARIEKYRREARWLKEKQKADMKYPQIVITDQGLGFLEKGQMRMYRNNAASVAEEAEDGQPVCIVSKEGRYIATGFYSSVSHVTVRILSRDPEQAIDEAFLRNRLADAYAYRKTTERNNPGCLRLVFGEADLLPGVIIDRYNDILVSQISCSGFEKRKDFLYQTMIEILAKDGQKIRAVYERNDIAAREKEGLCQYKGFYGAEADTLCVIEENGLKLNVDIENGQKTGYFLDQKSNRLLIREMAYGKKVLDCFTHTGGFALNAALGGAETVTAVDVSETALKQAQANAELNGLEERMQFVQADVFDFLETLQPNQYDLIILDPPAFTKSRKTVMKAYNGYKRINRMAMRVLKGGGYLATCSCSRYMETHLFEQMLKEASAEEGVLLRQVSVTQQNSDHPILWNDEDTSYLKFYIFQIL